MIGRYCRPTGAPFESTLSSVPHDVIDWGLTLPPAQRRRKPNHKGSRNVGSRNVTTPVCQLYLVMPAATPEGAAKLSAALAGGPIACLLLTPGDDGQFDPAVTRPLVKMAQAKGVAVLIANDAVNAKLLGADGVHLKDDPFSYDDARRMLGPKAIVGVEVGLSRHDAMELGERGADYVAFSDTGDETGDDLDEEAPAPAAIDRHGDSDVDLIDQETVDDVGRGLPDRIAWWAEVFTVPCVAWDVLLPEEAQELSALGADFIALAPEAWLDAINPGPVIDTFALAIGGRRTRA
jgi:thiamine-phosphate pyrophosphorylase